MNYRAGYVTVQPFSGSESEAGDSGEAGCFICGVRTGFAAGVVCCVSTATTGLTGATIKNKDEKQRRYKLNKCKPTYQKGQGSATWQEQSSILNIQQFRLQL